MYVHGTLVFVHVLGALALFAALGIELMTEGRLLRAETPAEARTWMGLLGPVGRLGGLAMLATVGSGFWLMKWWGHRPWLLAAILVVVALGALAGTVTGRGLKRLGRGLGSEAGPELSGEFREMQAGWTLPAALRMRTALGLGIVALMTFKPDTMGSVVIVGLAVMAGGAGALAVTRHPGVARVRKEGEMSWTQSSIGS